MRVAASAEMCCKSSLAYSPRTSRVSAEIPHAVVIFVTCMFCKQPLDEDDVGGTCESCYEEMAVESQVSLALPASTFMGSLWRQLRDRLTVKAKAVTLKLGPFTLGMLRSLWEFINEEYGEGEITPIKQIAGSRTALKKKWEFTLKDQQAVNAAFAPAFLGEGTVACSAAGAGRLRDDKFVTYIFPGRFVLTAFNQRGTKQASLELIMKAACMSEYGIKFHERRPPMPAEIHGLHLEIAKRVLRISLERTEINKTRTRLDPQKALLPAVSKELLKKAFVLAQVRQVAAPACAGASGPSGSSSSGAT
jgi:hypothetical protein